MNTVKNNKQITKSYKKLGFTHLETAEIVVQLKRLMANYQIHYHKLRNFHWNVEGSDFFELHEEFEKEYKWTMETIDHLAERIRVFGVKPFMSLTEVIKKADIKEVNEEMTSIGMVSEILKDFEKIHDSLLDVLTTALDNGDTVTEQLITDKMRYLEKRNWMYTSWCK